MMFIVVDIVERSNDITELIIPQFSLGLFSMLYFERLNLILFLGRRRRR